MVHGVGGLLDTVHERRSADQAGNGFVFREYSPASLIDALERALSAFADGGRWTALQAAGMREDNSWDHSAKEYVNIYRQAISRRRPGSIQEP